MQRADRENMPAKDATSIVQLLDAAQRDVVSAPQLLVQVYHQLRALAHSYLQAEREDQTLQATAVVHEAYMRLVGGAHVDWNSPAQFYAAAAAAIRSVLIDHARAKGRLKRGGDRKRRPLADPLLQASQDPDDFLRVNEAIERLERLEPEMAQVVRLRFFLGFDIEETARAMDVSAPTVKRRWQLVRAWLYRELLRDESSDGQR